jgi:hypothetical protein
MLANGALAEGLAKRSRGVVASEDATVEAGAGRGRADAVRLPFGSTSLLPASSLDHNCGSP